MRKNFLSRIARRKGAARAEWEQGHEIPPPTAIAGVPHAAGNSEDKGLGSHQELELIASGEPAPTGSANGADALDGGDAPALEALAGPVTDEPPDAPGPPREAAPYEGYGLDLELLSETESKASREEAESSHKDEAAAPEAADDAAEASAPEAEVMQESEPEAVDDAVAGDEEPLAAVVMPDSPDESPEPALAENGIFPLVRDARGTWRPGRGFSRGELREAGLSPADASRLHVRFDKRRGNTHPVNVASLEGAKSGVWRHEPAVKGSNDERIRIGIKLSRIRRIRRGK